MYRGEKKEPVVVKESLIKVFDNGQTKDNLSGSQEIIDLEIDIDGKMIQFQIGVTDGQMTLADIVPLAHTVVDKIIDVTVAKIESDADIIPCRRRCASCCSYLVPISVPEAFWLPKEIFTGPNPQRRKRMRACLLASRRILRHQPPKLFINQKLQTPQGPSDMNLISNWYKNLKLQCPFLDNQICTIYQARPLACKEHMVTGSPKACKGGLEKAQVVEIPVPMTDVLALLAAEIEETEPEAIIMPLLLAWCDGNIKRSHRTWPAAVMLDHFVNIINTSQSRKRQAITNL